MGKYRNNLKKLQKVGVIGIKRKSEGNGEPAPQIDEEAHGSQIWLNSNEEPLHHPEVLDHWRKTYVLRQNTSKSLYEIYDTWPMLRQNEGYHLVGTTFSEFLFSAIFDFLTSLTISSHKKLM